MRNDFENILNIVREQEEKLVFDAFNFDTAWNLGKIFVERAQMHEHKITISIRLASGFVVFQSALNGSMMVSETWLESKHNTVMLRNSSSLYMFAFCEVTNRTLESYKLFGNVTNRGGGFPLNVRGAGLIGSILVSGLDHFEDHNFIIECLSLFLNKTVPSV